MRDVLVDEKATKVIEPAPVVPPDLFRAPALLDEHRRLLVVRFDRPHRTLSSAVKNGGLRSASAVAWRQVGNTELDAHTDPEALLAASLAEAGLEEAIGLLTARDLSTFEEVVRSDGGMAARCVATVGLGNALAIGDPPGPLRPVGTINLLCQLAAPLMDAALVEACAIAAEAKTAAMIEADVPSRRTGRRATGTGTDCIVVAAPDEPVGERYVGKHTPVGALLGAAVHEATTRGIARWLEGLRLPVEHGERRRRRPI